MNAILSARLNQPWLWPVTALCFVLGVLLATSLQTRRTISRSGLGTDRVGIPPAVATREGEIRKRDNEIIDLRNRNTRLENSLGEGTKGQRVLNEELQKVKI